MMLAYCLISFHVKCLSRVLKKAECAVVSVYSPSKSKPMTIFHVVMIRIKCDAMKADISIACILSAIADLIHKEKVLS